MGARVSMELVSKENDLWRQADALLDEIRANVVWLDSLMKHRQLPFMQSDVNSKAMTLLASTFYAIATVRDVEHKRRMGKRRKRSNA